MPALVSKSDDKYFCRKDAANFLREHGCPVSYQTLSNLGSPRAKRKGPPFSRWRWGAVSYLKTDLVKWMAENFERVE